MNHKKIAVAGHLCVDITPEFPPAKVRKFSELLRPGKLLNVNNATISTGGAVANTGLALKKLGSEVVLIGKIGDDAFGSIIENIFQEYDADEHLIHAEGESSSYTIAIAPPGLDRAFLHHAGCNDTFCYEDLNFDDIAQAAHFHFGYPPIMRSMYLDGASELVKIFRKIKELGLTTSLDMAAVEAGSEADQQDWKQIIKNLLPYVDFFVPSIEELCYMIDEKMYGDWLERAGGDDITSILDIEKDVRPLAAQLFQWGAKCIMIKCGAPGIFFKTAGIDIVSQIGPQYEAWADLEWFEKSYVPDRILSGTGAGDTSIAAFLKAAIEGYPPQRCLQLAAATGASCITEYDSLSGLKSFEDLISRIDSGWPKN